uniref:DC_STAMP domain-containing protein n=1 Tax=Macrostomum lignano TaxID=282301 RepID=A0A1I8J5R2_9PLAT
MTTSGISASIQPMISQQSTMSTAKPTRRSVQSVATERLKQDYSAVLLATQLTLSALSLTKLAILIVVLVCIVRVRRRLQNNVYRIRMESIANRASR